MALLNALSPWSAVSDLQREMNQLVRSVFGTAGWGTNGLAESPRPLTTRTWTPAVDVFSRRGDLVVRVELPGVDAEKDVDISATDGVLAIRGQRRAEHREEGDDYFRMETTHGAFERTIPLPEGVNPDDIKATHKQGILEVVVPGAARIAPVKKIPIQIEGGAQEAIEGDGRADAEQA